MKNRYIKVSTNGSTAHVSSMLCYKKPVVCGVWEVVLRGFLVSGVGQRQPLIRDRMPCPTFLKNSSIPENFCCGLLPEFKYLNFGYTEAVRKHPPYALPCANLAASRVPAERRMELWPDVYTQR